MVACVCVHACDTPIHGMFGSVLRWSRTNHKLSLGVQSLVNNDHIPTGGGRGTESQSVGERGVARRCTGRYRLPLAQCNDRYFPKENGYVAASGGIHALKMLYICTEQ